MNNRKEDGLDNQNHEHENDVNQVGGFFAGLLIGGLAGAVAMLLLAPQSGKRTRAQIQLKSIELREQTTEAVEDALKQTRAQARQIRADVREKADELQERGQAVLDEQKEHWSALVEAGKTAVQGSQA
jgi:gas vesicle protein